MSQSTVEKLLGRPLAEEDRGTVPSLGDFPPALFDEARLLARESHLQAVYFLSYYVEGARLDDMADFIDEVLIGGADPQAWATNDYFCMPVTSWQKILCCEAPALLNPIASLGGGPTWGCVAPRRQDWRFTSTGAPGIQVRRRYDWARPINTMILRLRSPREIEAITSPEAALARWIASRIAWRMQADLASDPSLLSVEKLAQVLGIPAAQFSDLARHSIAALARELASLGWPDDEIPGFRGPDAWYAFPQSP